MRIYISGPITGMPNFNREAFAEASKTIKAAGHAAVNPHVVCSHLSPAVNLRSDFMRACMYALLGCNRIYFIESGMWRSEGVECEKTVAKQCGIKEWRT